MPLIQTSVVAPTGTQTGTPNLLGGRSGEIVDTRLHGDFFTAALNGKLFQATTLTAGTAISSQLPPSTELPSTVNSRQWFCNPATHFTQCPQKCIGASSTR